MAETRIHGLELVHVHHQERQVGPTAIGAIDLFLDDLVEKPAIINFRQRVHERELLGGLAAHELEEQLVTSPCKRPPLLDDVGVEQDNEHDESEDELGKIAPFYAHRAEAPHPIRKDEGDEPR